MKIRKFEPNLRLFHLVRGRCQNRRDVVKVLDHPGPTFFCHGYWVDCQELVDFASRLRFDPTLHQSWVCYHPCRLPQSGSLIRLPWSVLWWWHRDGPTAVELCQRWTIPPGRCLWHHPSWRVLCIWQTSKQIFQHLRLFDGRVERGFDSMNWSHIFKCSTTSMIELINTLIYNWTKSIDEYSYKIRLQTRIS
jgi:hypothetical protein